MEYTRSMWSLNNSKAMLEKIPRSLLVITGVFLLAILAYFFLQKNQTQITVKTADGTVSINNPATLPDKKPLSSNGVNFKDNANYSIDFYPEDQGFIIAILDPNIQAARDMAEKDFIQTLGISPADACKLKVSLAIPFRINEKVSGINYGLSFCPNGKAFPK